MLDLYSIGEMVIDFIPGAEAGSYVRNAGGAPANVAIAMARNGLKTGMCCSVGADDFGRFLIKTLEENQVRCLKPELCENAITTMAFVSLAENGERSFTFARKPGADMFLTEEDVKEEDIRESCIVHAGSCSLSAPPASEATVRALKLGHEHQKLVSFDVNYRNLMWKDDQEACGKVVMDLLPYVDILKISEEEVDMVGGEEGLFRLMERCSLSLIVETLGSAGAKCYFDGQILTVEGRKAKAVDATGAGDAFWGGFLSSPRLQGVERTKDLTAEKIRTALQYGNTAGWICVQHKGAISSLPTREEIEKHL